MKRLLLLALVLFGMALPAHAQSGFVTVSAQVLDPTGLIYQNCSGSADFVASPTATQVPTLGGSTFQISVPISGCDSFGRFTIVLADNSMVSDGHTGAQASQWSLSICSNTTPRVCFTAVLSIAGISQDISAALQAVSAPLPATASGGSLLYSPITCGTTTNFTSNVSTVFACTLTTSVTNSFFTTGGKPGTEFYVDIVPGAPGGFTFAFPPNVNLPPNFIFDTATGHHNALGFYWTGSSWNFLNTIGAGGGGGGATPVGNPGDAQCKSGLNLIACHINDNGTSVSITEPTSILGATTITGAESLIGNFIGLGPNPYFDILQYGGYFEPSNAPLTSSCSISSGSSTLSCASNTSFLNGHGVVIPKAGLLPLTRNASFPAVPTVGTVTPIGVSNGSTTYSYQFVLEDYFGGLTAAGTAGTTTTGAATLGTNTVSLTAMTRVSGLDTFTCSTNCNTLINSQVQISGFANGTNSTVNGTVVVNSNPDSTHFTVLANGLADYSESASGTLSVKACNRVIPSGTLTQESVIQRTWIYRGGTLVGVSPGQDPFFVDCGQGVSGQPAYVPSSVPGAAQAGYLATTVSSGGGTTTMTLAASASTTATSQTVQHDNSSALIAAFTAAVATHGGTLRIPVIPAGGFNTFPFNATTDLTTVTNATDSRVRIEMGLVSLNQPLIPSGTIELMGIPQASTSFSYTPLGLVAGSAHPLILANNRTSGGVTIRRLKFGTSFTGQSSLVIDENIGAGGEVGFIFDDDAFAGNAASAVIVKGGFDFWFTRGVCATTGTWDAQPCVRFTNASTYLGATTQVPGRMTFDHTNFTGGVAIQQDNVPNNSSTGGGNIFLRNTLHESNAGAHVRIAMLAGQAGFGVTISDAAIADQTNGLHQPILELTGTTQFNNITISDSKAGGANPAILGGSSVASPLCINNVFVQGCGQTPNQVINGVNSINDGGVLGAVNGGSIGYLMSAPAAPTSCVVSAGGSVPITVGLTYFLIATDRTPISTNPFQGLTLSGPTCTVTTTSGQQTVTVTRPTLPAGATGWLVWRSGAEANVATLTGSCFIPIPATTATFVDTFSFTCGPSAPSSNTAFTSGINSAGINSSHFSGGAYSGTQVSKTGNFTFTVLDYDVIGDPTGGAFTGTLPHAIAGQVWKITNKTSGANLITIQPDSGTILTPAGASSSVTVSSGVSDEFTCDGTNCYLKSSNSGGSTNVTNCNQFGIALYSAAGVANTINCFGPPVTVGIYEPFWLNPTAAATTPQVGQRGSTVNTQSASYLLTGLDRSAWLRFSGSTTPTLNMPAIALPFASNFPFRVTNYGSGNLTFSPVTNTINGAASLTLFPGWNAFVSQDNSPNWFADRIPSAEAFPGSCQAITFNSSSGFTCASLFYQTIANNGSNQPQRPRINLIPGTNITFTFADNSGTGSTDVTINSAAGGGGGYNLIQNNATSLPTRTTLNCTSGLTCIDDSTNSKTIARLPGITNAIEKDFIREHFQRASSADNNGNRQGDEMSYSLRNVAGTGTLVSVTAITRTFGGWKLSSGATSGNESLLESSRDDGVSGGFMPAVSGTAWTWTDKFQLGGVANNYYEVGATDSNLATATFASQEGFWCDVTNTGSAGNWACHTNVFSGSMQTTNITLSPTQTADTSAHILQVVASSTEVDFFWDGTKVGCTNSGGTGGCTAWTVGLTAATLSAGHGVKTNTAAAMAITMLGYTFEQ